jgi:predicted amidohydrolase YtcJ
VVAVGRAALDPALVGSRTTVLDLEGGTAVPGLCDAHAHLVGLGQSLEQVDLRGATSIDEIVKRLRDAAPPSGWIVGRGWDQNLWEGKAMPTHRPLTEAFPDRPVWLRRVDGHAGWGNAALLEAAGIERGTKAPAGGEILRQAGAPTGVLVDAAMGLVPVPPVGRDEIRRFILGGQAHAIERGLTGVHEMGIGPDADAVYRELADSGELKLRVHAYAAEDWFVRDLGGRAPDAIREDAVYTLAGVKVYADGALGSRGAALLEPYADRPDHRGLMQHDEAELRKIIDLAVRGGWQVATHAIGDAANRAVLDAYAAALPSAARRDARLRIEHAQIVHPDDIRRFAELGVIASMQPTHATSDMPWVPARIGDGRLAGAYAWRRFLDAGAHLCFGSDFPVELADVTHGLHAAVTRTDANGQPDGGWLPDQRLTLEQAVIAFSLEAAWAAHRDVHLGRLAPTMRADLTCFRAPLFELPPAQLRTAEIRGTIVDGMPLRWV